MTYQKVMLVTGAAKRIGAAIAQMAHAAGYKIVLHYRKSEKQTQELYRQLNQQQENSCLMVQADLGSVDEIVHISEFIASHWGRLDVLVNNASEFFPTHINEMSVEDYERLFDSNVKGPLFLSQSLYELLKATSGCIVNLVDIHAEKPLKNYPLYSMAKAANKMMVMALAKEMAPEVRVNGVAPGCILWPEQTVNDETKQLILGRTPLNVTGTTNSIYKAVQMLIDNKYMTGEIIRVDGGRHLNM